MLSKLQREALAHLNTENGWLRANIDFVHLGYDSGMNAKRILRNTFNSLLDRKLIKFSGRKINGRAFYDITPAGIAALGRRDQ